MSQEVAVAVAETTESPSAPAVASEQAINDAPTPNESGAVAAEKGPASAREFLQSLRKGRSESSVPEVAAEAAPEAATPSEIPEVRQDDKGNLHGPDGKFVAKDSAEPEAAKAEAGEAEATSVPEGFVKVPLPEGHPLRDRGREFIIAPADMENDYRGLVGANARRAEVEQLQAKNAELEEKLLREQARESAWKKAKADPQTLAAIEEVRSVDPNLAALMEAGLERKLQEEADSEFKTLADQRIQQEIQQEGLRFVQTARTAAVQNLPPEITTSPRFQEHFDRARFLYGADLDRREKMGQGSAPDLNEFAGFLKREVLSDPQIVARMREQMTAAERQKLEAAAREAETRTKQEAAEAERQRLEAMTAKKKTNPLGAVAMSVNTGRETFPSPGAPRNARELLATLKKA